MKSEPSELSIDALSIKKLWHWDGVGNYQARNYMRDEMSVGDLIIFYHSSCDAIGPAGIAKVASLPYPDHTQFDGKSQYFDPKSQIENPRWVMVDVAFVQKFPNTLSREEMKQTHKLKHMLLWSRPRLSIMPISKVEFDTIAKLAKI